jgi:exosome complex RNA-binding protein Rrp42 (RNase PH superfamily)
MNNLNCEYVREVYPDVLNQTADAATVAAVRAHVARCAECRAETALIEQLHRAGVAVPAGLHERVVAQIKTSTTPRGLRVRHLAFAATVAAAVIGGTLLLDPSTHSDEQSQAGLGFVTVEDAMVSGTSSLQDLTVEELEVLLGEIGS